MTRFIFFILLIVLTSQGISAQPGSPLRNTILSGGIARMTTISVEDIYGYQFGYLWWKDITRDMIFMSGHGGQYVCIIPSGKLMVVMTAEVNTQGEFQFGKEAFLWVDKIVQATY